jgi:MFS family permease
VFRRFLAKLPLTDRITFVRELLAAVAWGLYSGFALSLLSIIARRIGVSAGGLAFMLSMPFAGVLGSFIIGQLAFRRRKMPFVFWPNLAAAGVLMLAAFARTPAVYVAIVSAWYVLNGLTGPAYAAIVKANYGDENRGRLLGYVRMMITLIMALTSFAAGVILDLHPEAYRILLPFGALFGVANAFLFRRIKVRSGRSSGSPAGAASLRSSLSRVRRDRPFVWYLVLMFIAALPDKVGIPLEPILLVDEIGIDYRSAGLILGTLTSAVNMLGYWLVGRLAKHGRGFTLLPGVFALSAGRWVVLALATRTAHLVPASIITGLMNPAFDLLPMFAVMEFASVPELPFYMGIHNALLGIRGLIGPSLGMLIVESGLLGLRQTFWMIAVLTLAGAVFLQVFERRRHRRMAAAPPAPRLADPPSTRPAAP